MLVRRMGSAGVWEIRGNTSRYQAFFLFPLTVFPLSPSPCSPWPSPLSRSLFPSLPSLFPLTLSSLPLPLYLLLCSNPLSSPLLSFPVGSMRELDVIDVARQEDIRMKMREWTEYYESHPRRKILNVISLEFSETEWVGRGVGGYKFLSCVITYIVAPRHLGLKVSLSVSVRGSWCTA